ncbi:MAG: universal stress protein, partial [Gammaproteobacteria bacterium]|nr:universal stress protein [Gammaproteobacteria bacterium]
MKVILVPVADRPECARALRTAFDLGQRLEASVVGCHIRAHAYSAVNLPRSLLEGEAAWQQAIKKKPLAKSAAAKKLFGDVAEAHGYQMIRRPRKTPGAQWQE